MAINTKWIVKIGPASAPVDFTDNVSGLSVDQKVEIAKYSSQKATVTLWNYSGAFTPGGGGTYSSTDWFYQGCWIYARTDTGGATTDTLVFAGIIDTFDLFDDGEQSTVTFGCIDSMTVAGRQLPGTVSTRAFGTFTSYFDAYCDAIAWPAVGGPINPTTPASFTLLDSIVADYYGIDTPVTDKTLADILNQMLLPAQNSVMWLYNIAYSGGQVQHQFVGIDHGLTRNVTSGSVVTNTFTFDSAPNVAGTELPFTELAQGWSTDALTNYSTVKNLAATPLTTTWYNVDSVNKYGSRAVQFNNIMLTDTWATISSSAEWPNRFNTPRFTPVGLKITAEAVKSYCADAALTQWQYLLSNLNGLWQKANITWTGTGAASQTASVVITGRKIDATPGKTTMTLELANWTDFHSFILNTDKLDTDHLG